MSQRTADTGSGSPGTGERANSKLIAKYDPGERAAERGTLETREHVAAFKVVLSSEHFNLLLRPVDVDHAGFGFHQPDQAGSGGEVLGDLDVDVGEAVRRRDHFNREIGGEGPVAGGDAGMGNTIALATRRRRPGRERYRDPSGG